MEAPQHLLIVKESALIEACHDRKISNGLENVLKNYEKSLGIINTVLVQYEIKAESKPTNCPKDDRKSTELIEDSELVRAKFKLTAQLTGKKL